jgi:hypothetical protein
LLCFNDFSRQPNREFMVWLTNLFDGVCIWDLSESFFGGVRLGCNYGGRWIIGFDFLNASVGLYSIYIYVYIYIYAF